MKVIFGVSIFLFAHFVPIYSDLSTPIHETVFDFFRKFNFHVQLFCISTARLKIFKNQLRIRYQGFLLAYLLVSVFSAMASVSRTFLYLF